MTERIPCKTEGCRATILPTTAAKTGGYCMPCHQWQEQQKYQAYIEENRKTVNLYEGLTDPVEILKMMHAPRRHDPLIRYEPYPLKKERIYVSLTDDQAGRMLDYAMELMIGGGDGDKDIAKNILLSLICYRNQNIAGVLSALMERGIYYPSILYKDAPAEVRDRLLEQVEQDDENRNHILLILSWIGDSAVVGRFREWRAHPPQWTKRLYVAPEVYALEGGWELTPDGTRRDLIHHSNYAIALSDGPEPKRGLAGVDGPLAASFLKSGSSVCPWCKGKLTALIDVDASHPSVAYLGLSTDRLRIETCERCGCFGIIYMELDSLGVPVWSRFNREPDYLPVFDPEDSEPFAAAGNAGEPALSATPRSPFYAAEWGMSQQGSQIGGHPGWVQDAEYPQCPCCSKRMRFVGQVNWDDFHMGEGVFYMFVCPEDRLTASVYQQS